MQTHVNQKNGILPIIDANIIIFLNTFLASTVIQVYFEARLQILDHLKVAAE